MELKSVFNYQGDNTPQPPWKGLLQAVEGETLIVEFPVQVVQCHFYGQSGPHATKTKALSVFLAFNQAMLMV